MVVRRTKSSQRATTTRVAPMAATRRSRFLTPSLSTRSSPAASIATLDRGRPVSLTARGATPRAVCLFGFENRRVEPYDDLDHDLRCEASMKCPRPLRLLAVTAFAFASASVAKAQQPHAVAKPTLTSADYAKWETLGSGAISPDGKWVAYDIRRGNGTTEVRYRAVDGDKEQTASSANNPQYTANSRWLLYTMVPDTSGAAGRGGRGGRGGGAGQANGAAPANRNKLGVVDLRSGATTVFDDVQSYSLSGDGLHVALRRYGVPGHRGADVIVRDLDAGTNLTFGNVAEQSWSDDGQLLAMTVDVDGRTGNGIQLLDVRSGAIRSLDASANLYAGIQWREHSHDLAAMRSRSDSEYVDTSYVAIAWRGLGGGVGGAATRALTKTLYDFSNDVAFPKDQRVASYRRLEWSDDGSRLFFGIAPRDPRIVPVRRAPGELPPARVQVWHWKDLRQFHQQEVNANQDRQRTTLVAWRVGAPAVTRLSADPLETVQLSENGAAALAVDEGPYVREIMSGRPYRDVYRVDLESGKREKILGK